MSRRGICLIWFRGRHIPPSMPYREVRSVAKSSEGTTASKSDRTGRNPGMTRLVRRSSATSGGTAYFSRLVFKHSVSACVRKCSASPIPTILDIFSWNTWRMVRIILLQDRSLYHIPLPPMQCCVRIFRATTSSCGNQHWRKGETGMGVPTNVTSIVV